MEYREPAEIEVYLPKEGIVLRDISMIAIDQDGEGKILTIGNEAKYVQAAEAKIYSPMKEGKIAEWEDSCKIIRWYMYSTWGKRHTIKKAKVVVCILPDLTGIEKTAFEEALYRAGAKKVILSEYSNSKYRLIQEGDTYRIMWHSLDVNGRYKPMRHGRNEEFYANASVFAGKNTGRWQIYFR